MKKLTPELIDLVNREVGQYLRLIDKLTFQERASDDFYITINKMKETFQILKNTTGLNDSKLFDLIYNKTNTSSFWLADGTIRKDHP